MQNSSKDIQIFNRYGISAIEYYAMTCPYYGLFYPPKEMASCTVLEMFNSPYSADEYLQTIYQMIEKGLFSIITEEIKQKIIDWFKRDIPKLNRYSIPPIGTVFFTKTGYLLHRQIFEARNGKWALYEYDSFSQLERENQKIYFFAENFDYCQHWSHKITQFDGRDILHCIIGNALAEIVTVQLPEKIGKWSPSPFLTFNEGWQVSVTYKQHQKCSFNIPELGLKSTIESLKPVEIYGEIRGKRFSFIDSIGWTPNPDPDTEELEFNDECAIFEWHFSVPEVGELITDPQSVLSGETKSIGYRVAFKEDLFYFEEETSRRTILSIPEAKKILIKCVKKYLSLDL